MNQCKYIAMVPAQKLPQVPAAPGLDPGFGNDAARNKVLVDLIVELFAVSDDHKTPVARHLAQHLLGEEDHGDALAAALGVPEYPQAPLPLLDLGQGGHGIVHAQVLVILGHYFNLPAGHVHEQGEVLYQIQETRGLAGAPKHRLQGDAPFLGFAADLFPLGKVFPACRDAAHPALAAIGEND